MSQFNVLNLTIFTEKIKLFCIVTNKKDSSQNYK